MTWNKPLPFVDQDNAPFWEGAKQHKFMLFHCKVCGAWYWPKAFCRNHDNEPMFGNMEWAEASGKGKVFTFSITHQAFHPGWKDEVPFTFALVELDEGPMFGSTVIDCDPYDVKVGMPVEVVFKDVPEIGFSLPYFRPVK